MWQQTRSSKSEAPCRPTTALVLLLVYHLNVADTHAHTPISCDGSFGNHGGNICSLAYFLPLHYPCAAYFCGSSLRVLSRWPDHRQEYISIGWHPRCARRTITQSRLICKDAQSNKLTREGFSVRGEAVPLGWCWFRPVSSSISSYCVV